MNHAIIDVRRALIEVDPAQPKVALPPLTEWPAAWLDPHGSPRVTIQSWLADLGLDTPELDAALSNVSEAELWAVVAEVMRSLSSQLLQPTPEQSLLSHLISELSSALPIYREEWARDEREMKRWLKARMGEITSAPVESAPSSKRARVSVPLAQPLPPVSRGSAPSFDDRLDDTFGAFPDAEYDEEYDEVDAEPPPALSALDQLGADLLEITGAPPPSPAPDLSLGDAPAPLEGGEGPPRPSASTGLEVDESVQPSAEKRSGVLGKISSQEVARRIIGTELTRPGPLERIIEKARWMSLVLYKISGFSTLILLHIIDNMWEFITSYVSRVFKGWMYMRSAARVAARRADGKLIESLKRDVNAIRWVTERALCLPQKERYSFDLDGAQDETELSAIWSQAWSGGIKLTRRDTPLTWALSARARLDDLRRDLNFIRSSSGAPRRLLRAIGDWLLGLIPNPFELLRPWLNVLLLSFKIRDSRAQVHGCYRELNASLDALIDELELLDRDLGRSARASAELVGRLQSQLDALIALCLQSGYQARPWRWQFIDQFSALKDSQADYAQPEHPLSALVTRKALLEVCADLERQPEIGARFSPQSKSYEDELAASRVMLKCMRALRERGRL